MPVAEPAPPKIAVEWLDKHDIARILNTHYNTIMRWEQLGRLPAATRMLGDRGRPRWRSNVVERFIEGR